MHYGASLTYGNSRGRLVVLVCIRPSVAYPACCIAHGVLLCLTCSFPMCYIWACTLMTFGRLVPHTNSVTGHFRGCSVLELTTFSF